ncbi:MAG: hypothetical protein M3P39_01325 [Actinomycetota bacterium]|nr:hypothetical protein [Actinomycetota bacterium]
MSQADHQRLLDEALVVEAEGHRALLAGDAEGARALLADAARRYRASWDAAPPTAFGRLVGLMKDAVLAGEARDAVAVVRGALGDDAESPTAAWALAIAALADGDDALTRRAAQRMRAGGEAFARTADAVTALADGDEEVYARALLGIVADFEGRAAHLTGVPIADTALLLERLAEPRGLAVHPHSPVLPGP